jgi:ABC-type Fe3+/spermidine/putrescine transport system ATPase subunit
MAAGEAMLGRNGLRFAADAPAGASTGQKLTVAIRPEHVLVHRLGAPEVAGSFEAVVRDAIFKGSHIHYELAAGEERLQVLTLPPVDGDPLAPGERARITFPKGRIIAFGPDEADARG